MKYILLIIFCFSFNSVKALDIGLRKTGKYICDESNVYTINDYNCEGRDLYFLNLNDGNNIDFTKYEEVDFAFSGYPEEVLRYAANYFIIKFERNLSEYLQYAQRLIWEYLYPDKKFYFCNRSGGALANSLAQENTYQEIKDFFLKVLEGPKQELIIKENVSTYEDKILNFFTLISEDEDFQLDSDKLLINKASGKYTLTFEYKNFLGENEIHLFSDGENFLIKQMDMPEKKFQMSLLVGNFKLKVLAKDTENNLYLDSIFEIYENDTLLKTVQSNEEIYLKPGSYTLKDVTNKNVLKSFETLEITLDKDLEVINEYQKVKSDDKILENKEENQDDMVTFVPEDTFASFNFIPFLFLSLCLGVYLFAKN